MNASTNILMSLFIIFNLLIIESNNLIYSLRRRVEEI